MNNLKLEKTMMCLKAKKIRLEIKQLEEQGKWFFEINLHLHVLITIII